MDLNFLYKYDSFQFIPLDKGPCLSTFFFKVRKNNCGMLEFFTGNPEFPVSNLIFLLKDIKKISIENISNVLDIIHIRYIDGIDYKLYAKKEEAVS